MTLNRETARKILTDSIRTAKQFFFQFEKILGLFFQFFRPQHDCYVKLLSCLS